MRRCSDGISELAERLGNQPTQVVEAAEHRRAHHVEHEREQTDHRADGRHVRARSQSGARGGRGGTGDPAGRVAAIDRRGAHRRHQAGGRSPRGARRVRRRRAGARRARPGVHDAGDDGARARDDRPDACRPRPTCRAGDASSTREAIEREYRPPEREPARGRPARFSTSRDQVMALEGVAGTGKTTALAAVRDAAEREGYQVEGFAPTSRAAHKLAEAGIESSTLQRHLARGEDDARPTIRSASTSSTNRAWRARSRCTRSWSASDRTTACCSWATSASMKPSMPVGRITSSRRRGSAPRISTTSCGSTIRS